MVEGPAGKQERAVRMQGPASLQGQRIEIPAQEAVVAYRLLGEVRELLGVGSRGCWV